MPQTNALPKATELTLQDVRTSVQLIDDAIYTDGVGTPVKAIAIAGTDGTNPQIIKTDSDGNLSVSFTGGTAYVKASYGSRSDTYTTATNGAILDINTQAAKHFTIQVKGTDAIATAWDVRLEGSLDGVNFTQILQHTNVTGDGVMLYSGANISPSQYMRSRCAGITLGAATNIVVYILGIQ